MQADQRDVAFRTDDTPRGERFGDVDDVGVLDHVIARPHGRRVCRGEKAPCRLDRDRPGGQSQRMVLIGQVLALAPAAVCKRRVLRFVDARFVAGIGAILRHQRIGGHARREELIEIHERFEGRERFRATVDIRSARVRRVVGRPWLRRDRPAVRTDLEQFITGFEGLPDTGAGIAKRLGAVRDTAMSRVGQRGPIERDEGAPGEIVQFRKLVDVGLE